MFDAEKNTLSHHIEGVVPIFHGSLGQGANGSTDTSIVKQDIEPTIRAYSVLAHGFDIRLVCYIGLDKGDIKSLLGRCIYSCRAGLFIEIGNDHLGALGGEFHHCFKPHTAGATGHHSNFSC